MNPEILLARRYARLLRLLPRPEREARAGEMLGVLMEAADPGRRRPSLAETVDLLRAALRSRIRCLLVADPVARFGVLCAASLLVAGSLVVGIVLDQRGLVGTANARADGAPVLPDRLPDRLPRPVSVENNPGGTGILAWRVDIEAWETDASYLMVLAADGSTVRRIPLRWAAEVSAFQLSPDGARLAYSQDGTVLVSDLRTGRTRVLPAAAASDGHGQGWPHTPLAFSADSTQLVVTSGGSTSIVDLTGAPLLTLPHAAKQVAFARDGRLAVTRLSGRIDIYSAAGRRLGGTDPPKGWQLAPAGWSGDGTRLAVEREPDTAYRDGPPPPRAYAGVRLVGHGEVPTLLGPAGGSVPVAWQGDSLVVLASDALQRWDPSASSGPIVSASAVGRDIRVATGLTDGASIRPAGQVDRGPLSPVWPLVALVSTVAAAVWGWAYPLTRGRAQAKTARDATWYVRRWLGNAAVFVILLWGFFVGIPLMGEDGFGLDTHLLLAAILFIAASGFTIGRSLGRARYVIDSRVTASTAAD